MIWYFRWCDSGIHRNCCASNSCRPPRRRKLQTFQLHVFDLSVVFFQAKTSAVLLLLPTVVCFAPPSETYFIPVSCFLLFNLMDWAGRSLTAVCMWVSNNTNSTLCQQDSDFLTCSEGSGLLFGLRADCQVSCGFRWNLITNLAW